MVTGSTLKLCKVISNSDMQFHAQLAIVKGLPLKRPWKPCLTYLYAASLASSFPYVHWKLYKEQHFAFSPPYPFLFYYCELSKHLDKSRSQCHLFSKWYHSSFFLLLNDLPSNFTLQQLIVISFLFHPTPHILCIPQQDPMELYLSPISQTELPALSLDLGGIFCENCSWFTPFMPCKSNKNRNKGPPFVIVCFIIIDSQTHAYYFLTTAVLWL